MTGFDRYDILIALFLFIDIAVHKPRPVLVLSGRRFDDLNGHAVTAMITTGAGSRWPSDQPNVDSAAAGLQHSSVVRCKLFTVPNAQIGRRIGYLSEPDRSRIAEHLNGTLCGPLGNAP